MGPDQRAAQVASAYFTIISIEQLRECGLTDTCVQSRLAKGLLHRLHRGVYHLGSGVLPPLAREAAALLACGATAVLAGRSAGGVLGICPSPPGIDVVVRPPRHPRRKGVRVRREQLDSSDITVIQGLRVTTARRTLIDLADDPGLERLLAEAHGRKLVDLRSLAREPGLPPRLRAVLEAGPGLTRSGAERRLRALVRRAGLPAPETNVQLGAWNLDALWRAERLAVEVDSWSWHGDRAAFERDRRKDRWLRAQGLTPLRVTAWQVDHEPEAVVADVAAALAVARVA